MVDWLTQNAGAIISVMFSVSFVLLALWAFKPSNKHKMQDQGMIPFHEEHTNG